VGERDSLVRGKGIFYERKGKYSSTGEAKAANMYCQLKDGSTWERKGISFLEISNRWWKKEGSALSTIKEKGFHLGKGGRLQEKVKYRKKNWSENHQSKELDLT